MEALFAIFSAFGLSASAGLNAYIPLLVVGVLAHYTDLIKLTPPFDTLANPWILIMLGILLIIEMLADKVPAVNHVNDLIQTFVRPVAGAIVFAAGTNVIHGIHPVVALACGLLVAGGVHLAKSVAVRPLVTATTGGAGNVPGQRGGGRCLHGGLGGVRPCAGRDCRAGGNRNSGTAVVVGTTSQRHAVRLRGAGHSSVAEARMRDDHAADRGAPSTSTE